MGGLGRIIESVYVTNKARSPACTHPLGSLVHGQSFMVHQGGPDFAGKQIRVANQVIATADHTIKNARQSGRVRPGGPLSEQGDSIRMLWSASADPTPLLTPIPDTKGGMNRQAQDLVLLFIFLLAEVVKEKRLGSFFWSRCKAGWLKSCVE